MQEEKKVEGKSKKLDRLLLIGPILLIVSVLVFSNNKKPLSKEDLSERILEGCSIGEEQFSELWVSRMHDYWDYESFEAIPSEVKKQALIDVRESYCKGSVWENSWENSSRIGSLFKNLVKGLKYLK